MNGDGTRPWAVALSLLLHVGVIALLWWGAREAALKQPQPEQPLALELISGGGSVTAPAPEPVSKPVPVEEPPPVVQPPAEVNLGKPEAKKPELKKEKPPLKLAEAKPEPKPKEKPKTPEKPAPAKKPTVDNPTKAKRKSSDVNDLLADLPPDLPPGPKQGKDKVSQGGAKVGVEGGSSKGSGMVAGYQAKVRAKIRPLVHIPDSVTGNPSVHVRIRVFPSLEVDAGSITVSKSSGNADYDNAVKQAIREAGSLPPLLPGMTIDDVRTMNLVFRPNE
jgi:colicin import membrane protein